MTDGQMGTEQWAKSNGQCALRDAPERGEQSETPSCESPIANRQSPIRCQTAVKPAFRRYPGLRGAAT